MSIKNQLRAKFKSQKEKRKEERKRVKRENRIEAKKYRRLKKESKHLIDERLEKIILDSPFCEKDGWTRIEARGKLSYERGKVKSQLILDNGYIIEPNDVRRFCIKNRLRLRYEYIERDNWVPRYYTYIFYKGEYHCVVEYYGYVGVERYERDEYFYAYLIG